MDTRREQPEALGGFEAATARRTRIWAWALTAFWLLLAGGDWAMRFGVFRWQQEWWPRPPVAATSAADRARPPGEVQVTRVPEQTGAGLTRMVPVRRVAERYVEIHPAYEQIRDAWGYFNGPAPEDGYYPVVMVGDSFMISLGTQHVAEVLADRSGVPVYNHGMFGAGPFKELENMLLQDRFHPVPQVVVWNLSARELGAPLFARQPVDAWFRRIDVWAHYKASRQQPGIRWAKLAPEQLSRAWPDTSILAYGARQAWAKVKLRVFRSWPPEVRGAEDPRHGPMLFYRENIRLLSLYDAGQDAPVVVDTVKKVAAGLRQQGTELVVILVPEKEQIHVAALPPGEQAALAGGAELLAAIESGLESAGIPAVNLMPVFQEATAGGQRLYWRDDTHWNDAGIRLAAEELWKEIERLLEKTESRVQKTEDRVQRTE